MSGVQALNGLPVVYSIALVKGNTPTLPRQALSSRRWSLYNESQGDRCSGGKMNGVRTRPPMCQRSHLQRLIEGSPGSIQNRLTDFLCQSLQNQKFAQIRGYSKSGIGDVLG